MIDRRHENAGFDATHKYQREVNDKLANFFPDIRPDMRPEDPVVQGFLSREHRYVSLPLKKGRVPEGIVRDMLVKGLEFGLTPGDAAFSSHAAEHMVALEAVQRVSEQLNKDPRQVTVELQQRILEKYPQKPNEAEDSVVTTFVLQSAPEVRNIVLPLPIEVGNQLKQRLDTFDVSNEASRVGRNKTARKVIRDLALNIAPDFAVIVALSAELSLDEIWEILKSLKGEIPKLPSTSRPQDTGIIAGISKNLMGGSDWLSFSAEDQQAAIRLARSQTAWGNADDVFWQYYQSPRMVSSQAVVGGLDYQAAYLANKHTPNFRNYQKQDFIERYKDFATTQLITAFNKYDPSRDTRFLSSDGILNYITSS